MPEARRPLTVMFIAHGAERTGPPIYLLRILQGLRNFPDVSASVVLVRGGPLLGEFQNLAPTWVLEGKAGLARAWLSSFSSGALPRRLDPGRWRRMVPGMPDPDVVVVNTAGSIVGLDALGLQPRRLVSHVHELATGFEFHLSPDARSRLLEDSHEIWVVSDAVRCYLETNHSVSPQRLRRHRGVLAPKRIEPMGWEDRLRVKASLGVSSETILVGTSGTLDWRKAPDLLLEAAQRALARARSPLCFLWIGGRADHPWARVLGETAVRLGIGDSVRHIGETDRPEHWFGALDLFVLASREDAYPLVCLEAAAGGAPILAFDSGGTSELIGDDAGVVVPFPDVAGLAVAIARLADNAMERTRLASGARAAARRHSLDLALPALVADLRKVAGR